MAPGKQLRAWLELFFLGNTPWPGRFNSCFPGIESSSPFGCGNLFRGSSKKVWEWGALPNNPEVACASLFPGKEQQEYKSSRGAGEIDGIWEGGVGIGELPEGALGSLGFFGVKQRQEALVKIPGIVQIRVSSAVPCPNPNGARAGHPRPDGVTRYRGMFENPIPTK